MKINYFYCLLFLFRGLMVLGVIPARFGSTRLMGKPLADICGKPMIQRTYESAKTSKLINKLVVAVDDQRVFDVVKGFGADVILTPQNIATGSDRIAWVAEKYPQADILVNIQGDEPFIPGLMIDEAIEPLLFDFQINVSTLAKRIRTVEEMKSSSVAKVVFDYNNFAMYFSRSPIPFVRDARTNLDALHKGEMYKHIGLYVYRRESLMKFTSLPPTDLEKMEKLEQLRMLEHSFKIKIVETQQESFSVDTPEDLEYARNYFMKYIAE